MTTTPQIPEVDQPAAQSSLSPSASPVENKRPSPTGPVSKNLQTYIILGVALLMVVAVWMSNTTKKPNKGAAGTAGTAAADQPNGRVSGLTPEDVSRRLELSEKNRQAQGGSPDLRIRQHEQDQQQQAANPDKQFLAVAQSKIMADPLEEERRKRAAAAPFASNIALSYRGQHPSTAPQEMNAAPFSGDMPIPNVPGLDAMQEQLSQALAKQQALAAKFGLPETQSLLPQQAKKDTTAQLKRTAVQLNQNQASGKPHLVFEGTMLETVLVNRLNSDFSGPVICQVTTNLYSHDHTQLLIPQGTKALGEVHKVSDMGQSRVAVAFHRLIMPDGYAVNLDQAPALNQIGETALTDQVNNHYFKIFGSAIAVGAIAGFAQINSNNSSVTGLPASSSDSYRQGVSSSVSQSSIHILDKFLNQLPTITIREGHRVKVFFTQDLMLPAYSQHRMPSDL